jgi:hypothetical protein
VRERNAATAVERRRQVAEAAARLGV